MGKIILICHYHAIHINSSGIRWRGIYILPILSMKEFKKFSIEFAIIVAIFLAADYIIGTALDKTCAFRDFPSSFRNIPEADYDMVIMGGSRAQSSYDIKMLQDSLGLSILRSVWPKCLYRLWPIELLY